MVEKENFFIMSEENEAVDTSCCASCGIAEIDDIKLTECDGCDLVKYCSDDCMENHKSEHEEACKTREAELLRDELLFKQPESSYLGDCPICSLPLPLDGKRSVAFTCCSKVICKGCMGNIIMTRTEQARSECPFCRHVAKTMKEGDKLRMKRVKVNDPYAMTDYGKSQLSKGFYSRAIDYLTKAAELGSAEAHQSLAQLYHGGHGVEKDEGKEIYHLEKAAIGGHPHARHNLGAHEYYNGNIERAVKHWIIAATQGDDRSIETMVKVFKKGYVSKEDLASALRAHKAAVDATKSPQRELEEKISNFTG